MSNNICLATCFLKMNDDLVEFWNSLSEELERSDHKLVLLVTVRNDNLKVTHFIIPYSVVEYSEWFNFNFVNEGIATPLKITNAIKNDFESRSIAYDNFDSSFNGSIACNLFMVNIVEILKPSIALLWNLDAPQSKIFSNVLDQNEIPFFSIERGLLPDTLMIDNNGINGLSDINRIFAIRSAILSYNIKESYKVAKKYYLSKRIEKYKQPVIDFKRSYRTERKIENKIIIGFIGQWDHANGFFSDYSNRSRIHSPVFESTSEILYTFSKALKDNQDLIIVIKPHPQDRNNYTEFECLGNVIVEKEINIYTVMEEANILLFNGSTVQFDSLFYEKPIILASNSQLAGKGIAYEIKSKDSIIQVLNDAIMKKGFEDKLDNAARFISWVLDNYLIKINNNTPANNSYKELATFIFQSSIKYSQCNSSERIIEFCESMERIRK